MNEPAPSLLVFATLALTALVGWFVRPLIVSFGRRLEGPRGPDPETLAEMDRLRQRLADVEDRLDFAERMLAQSGTAAQLPGGSQR
jgi:hypothetical protein